MSREFNIADTVVCPGHGLGRIAAIESQEQSEGRVEYYVFEAQASGMTVWIATGNARSVGLRRPAGPEAAQQALTQLEAPAPPEDLAWDQRYEHDRVRLRTGGLTELVGVIGQLGQLARTRTLLVTDNENLDAALRLLVPELAQALGQPGPTVERTIRAATGLEPRG